MYVHICKPLDWNVIPSEPASFDEFICLKQTEEECSLPRFYFLRQKSFGCKETIEIIEYIELFFPHQKRNF